MNGRAIAWAGAVTLTCAVLLGTPPEGAAQHASTSTLGARVDQTLGLADSTVGDLRVLPATGDRLLAGLALPGASLLLDLAPHSVRAEGFEARAQLEDGSWVALPPEPVRTYRGTILGEADSRVAASLLDDGLHARIVLADGEEFWIEPLAPRVTGARIDQHVLYSTEDVLATGTTCDADRIAPFVDARTLLAHPGGAGTAAGTAATAELACDADYEYFSTHGGGTQARIESVVNTVNLQYASEVGITHQITTILIRTSSNDPYTKKPAEQLLVEFRNEWNSNQSGVQRDVAHLFTGRNLAGGTIGIAYTGTVCNLSFAYSLVESDFVSNFACSTDLTAHELGHNWGASHCSCSSFTMNPSITCANTFHPTITVPVITAYRDSQSCFGAPPATGSVSGTVTDSTSGSPIGGATVQVDTGQSDTTAGDGTYTLADVPTGSRTVSASAPGYDAQNQQATVNENQTTVVNFALDPAPAGSQAIVECITYRGQGGPTGDKNLFIDILVTDDLGMPVDGASVSVEVDLDGAPYGTGSATTGADGTVTFQAKNSPNGCYETDVTSVSAAGLAFDGSEPLNGFAKGSDSHPDMDCRSSSDPCGSG